MVNRVVLQHMSINLEHPEDESGGGGLLQNENNKENIIAETNVEKTANKRKAPPPFGLSPPSESKLLQRRKHSQSLNFNCRKSGITKNSNSFVNLAELVKSPSIVESPGC